MNRLKIKLLLVTAGIVLGNFAVFSQSNVKELTIGDKVPEIVFNEVINYKASKIKLSTFKGKIIVLDFWATWCAPCVAALPAFNELQQKFKDEVVILPVSFEQKEAVIKFKYKRKDLDLPFAIEPEDSHLRSMFPHRIISHTVMIDQNGVVIAITEPKYITQTVIEKVLNKEKISLYHKNDLMNLNMNKPLFLNGNGGNGENALFRSIITPFLQGTNHGGGLLNDLGGYYYGLNLKNAPITQLYEYAYNLPHIYRNRIILEGISDVKRFPIKLQDYMRLTQQDKIENQYCYSLSAPFVASKDIQIARTALTTIMKSDLNRIFGTMFGLNVSYEAREKDCYIVKTTADFDLKKISAANERNAKLLENYTNISISDLEGYLIEFVDEKPITDETNVGGLKIWFKRRYLPYKNNLVLINQDLKEYGLEVVEGKRMIDMLVFKVNK